MSDELKRNGTLFIKKVEDKEEDRKKKAKEELELRKILYEKKAKGLTCIQKEDPNSKEDIGWQLLKTSAWQSENYKFADKFHVIFDNRLNSCGFAFNEQELIELHKQIPVMIAAIRNARKKDIAKELEQIEEKKAKILVELKSDETDAIHDSNPFYDLEKAIKNYL